MIEFTDTDLTDVIRFENVLVSYPTDDGGEKVVLDHVTFLIEAQHGQFVVLLGPSGCGKSTILRLIAGLQNPQSGTILVNGNQVSSNSGIGMVFQSPMGFDWRKVVDNVAFALEVQGVDKATRREAALKMLEMVELADHADKFCKHPDLSGGQLQRVAIARSLMGNPELLLLDEPFAKLDVRTKLNMELLLKRLFLKLAAGTNLTTFLMVTHDISEAVFLADQIWIMSPQGGHIVQRYEINLPKERDFTIKKTQEFRDYVYDIEKVMMDLGGGVIQSY